MPNCLENKCLIGPVKLKIVIHGHCIVQQTTISALCVCSWWYMCWATATVQDKAEIRYEGRNSPLLPVLTEA